MITTTTLDLNHCQQQTFLPAFWRLGQLNNGLPLLWPMTYQQAMIVECNAKSHLEAYRLVENCVLSLSLQTPAHLLQVTVYEHSLRASFPALKNTGKITAITYKKQLKDYVGELQQIAHQRQALLAELKLASWYEYLAINQDAEPFKVLVLSQVWPDIELLVELADLCQYGVRLGILPILILSSRYFPKIPHDEWQINISGAVEEIIENSLRVVVHRDASLEVKHQQLQDMAELYQFFKPTVDFYSPVN